MILVLFLCSFTLLAAAPDSKVDFQRDIRPVLSDNCFACHGPDSQTRMAELRLDRKDDAFAPRKTGAAIVPGNPDASLLYQRITDPKPARRMPPLHSHKTLTDEQKATLRRWIAQGASWREHWSFTAPTRPAMPSVKDKSWPRNPIDHFILAKLESNGLRPASQADRRTLIRRATLDLTGLPPSPGEVDAFLNDTSPDAYEKLLDRLFASPHYGEHRGRYWLDAARYGDTHGVHIDNYREMWPYRDWVIQAYNRNLPFDQFTIEQIAGDLLPNHTMDQQIASGFHRCNVTTNEGGVIVEEVEAIYAKDRVDTTGAVWLGLTIGCAACHDHKFDAILQKDFYSLAAFFRNTTQRAMDGNIPDTPPIIIVPREEDRPRLSQIRNEESAIREKLRDLRQSTISFPDPPLPSRPFPIDEMFVLTPERVPLSKGVTLDDQALHFADKADLEIPGFTAIQADQPFTLAVRFWMPKGDDTITVASQVNPRENGRGWTIEIGGRVALVRLTGDRNRTITIRAAHVEQIAPGTWNHLVITYDGSREQSGLSMYLNGVTIPTQGAGDVNVELRGELAPRSPLKLGGGLGGGAISDFRVYNRALNEDEAHLLFQWPKLHAGDRDALRLYYTIHHLPAWGELAAKLPPLAEERRAIRKLGGVTHVMHEKADSMPSANILYRGMYDQPRDKVDADVPSALPPMDASLPRNRLGLARWLVDPANPLTARVTVNRFWQEVFGTGLVKTAEDFGSQGFAPTHPELLDWLAVEFRESGWDMQKFYKSLLLSATYRQAAQATPEKLAKDPENKLLSRGPRFRLDGELVRDYALASSGLLVPTIGGPSVKPYQPDNIWEAVAMNSSNTRFYKRDDGDKLYRRSMYTFWKRSAPPASMEIFNAPSRENCSVRRERTNTPLQALVTMNDVQFIEAARYLAQRALQAYPREFDRQLDFVTLHLVARPFGEKERSIASRAWRDYLSYYDSHPEEARKLLQTGEMKANPSLAPAEFAALTMVVNQIMNLDEVLNK